MGVSYFKAMRSAEARELLAAKPKAFLLLYVIAHRARWSAGGFNPHNLNVGEAFLGDYENYGLTEREYRDMKDYLFEHRFATFRRTDKGTRRGTIATLLDTRVFDINAEAGDGQKDGLFDAIRTAEGRHKDVKQEGSRRLNKVKDIGTGANAPAPVIEKEWLESLKANPAYAGIDLERELGKMTAWCHEHHNQPTRRRFINWLNRTDKPIQTKGTIRENSRNIGIANDPIQQGLSIAAAIAARNAGK